MLNKTVACLKQTICIKAIIYIVITIILCTLIPILKKEINTLTIRKKEAREFSKTAMLESDSIIDFENKIWDINNKYKKLMRNAGSTPFLAGTTLIKNMHSLSKKYQLFEPIEIKITRNFHDDIISNGHIQIHYYDTKIKFKASNYTLLLNIIREIYLLLPKGAIVDGTNIQISKVLTPKIIKKLNSKKSPDYISVEIQIQLREIAYEK